MDGHQTGPRIPHLTGVQDFFAWRKALRPILVGICALGIVQGIDTPTVLPPVPTSVDLKLSEAWKDRDAKALSYMQQTVSGPLHALIESCSSSAEAWNKLHDLNDLTTPEHRATINRKAANLFLEEAGDMDKHLNQFIEIAEEAEAAGLSWGKDQFEKALHFLDTFPHSLRPLKSDWRALPESQKNFFGLVKLYKEEETARKQSAEREADAVAMTAFKKRNGAEGKALGPQQKSLPSKKGNRQQGPSSRKANDRPNKKNNNLSKQKNDRCFGCGEYGHQRTDCPKTAHLGSGGIICWKRHKKGHTSNECRAGQAKATQADDHSMLGALIEEHTMLAQSKDSTTIAFMVDSGASHHVVEHEWMLSTPGPVPEIKFKTIGHELKGKLSGDIVGCLSDGRGVTFKGAVHLPDGGVNLLSEELLMERGWKKHINDRGDAVLQHTTKSDWRMPLIKRGRARYLIVHLKTTSTEAITTDNIAASMQTSQPKPKSWMYWHEQLAHVGMATLKKLQKAGMIDVDGDNSITKLECETCLAAKAHRSPFNEIPLRAKKPLELCVSDLSSPFKPAWGGFTYFGTFIDDFTDLTTVVLLKSKDEIFAKFKTWVSTVERAFNAKVQVLRTDGGGEYTSKAMTEWLEKNGILHHITPPHTPQLNGKAERKNRTLKEMTAAMLLGSNMKTQWWGHAILFAAGLLMRITKTRDGDSLWELVHKRKPSLNKAHAFGSDCWVHVPASDRTKSDLATPKAWKGQLVSWPNERSGWGIYSPRTDKVVYSRDVSFPDRPDDEIDPCLEPTEYESGDELVIPPQEANDIIEDVEDHEVQPEDNELRHRVPRVNEEREHADVDQQNERPVRALPHRQGRGQHAEWYRQNFALLLQKHEGHIFPITPIDQDPLSYDEALARSEPERQKWIDAITKEFDSLVKNGTLEEVVLPAEANVVDTKHVFKTKYDAQGNFVKRKDRCVARGFTQEFGVDYNDTYAPVARMSSLRIFFVIVIISGFIMLQMDVETAFLNPDMDRPLYISFPQGWKQKNPNATGLLVKKGLYGFKQSARLWWLHLMDTLYKLGFVHSEVDWGIFLREERNGDTTIVFVYVDDLIIASKTQSVVNSVRTGLKKAYTMTDIGEVSSILGISVRRTEDAIYLSQSHYIETVLNRFGLGECRSEPTPIAVGTKLVKDGTPLEGGKDGIRRYQALIGCLLWIGLSTRPDICYAVSSLARFSTAPTKEVWRIAMRVLRYLQGTKECGLQLKPDSSPHESKLIGYSDADWASNVEDRQSQTGYLFKLHNCTVSWGSLRQDCVALSSVESEYIALTEAAKEASWLIRALSDYKQPATQPVLIRGDNQGSLALASNPGFHRRTKHIELRYHYIRRLKTDGVLDLEYIDTHNQTADILTKAVSEPTLMKHREATGITLLSI